MDEIALDIETTGLNWKRDAILYIGKYPNKGALTQSDTQIWHNGSFDLKFLKEQAQNPNYRIDEDTYLMSSLIPHKSRGLLALVKEYFPEEVEDIKVLEENKVKRDRMKDLDREILQRYCTLDCKYTLKLYRALKDKLKGTKELEFYYKHLLPAYRVIIKAEMEGVNIDQHKLKWAIIKTREEKYKLEINMRNCVKDYIELEEKLWLSQSIDSLKEPKKKDGKAYKNYLGRQEKRRVDPKLFNWNSPKQVLWLLKDCLKLKCISYEGKESIGESVLKNVKHEHTIIPMILKYKELSKLLSAFLLRWQNDLIEGKLYTNYDITGTRTGRLSSSNPNLQQVPRSKEIRSLFTAPEGYTLICSDYSQIEPRVAAYYADEDLLKWVFKQKIDPYGQIACDILGFEGHPNTLKEKDPILRQLAKTIMLAMSYGAGARKLQWIIRDRLDKRFSIEKCIDIVRDFNTTYRKLSKLKHKIYTTLLKRKGKIYNLYGRPLFLEEKQYRNGFNTLIQSTASDICLFKQQEILNIFKQGEIDGHLVLLNHDECVYKVDEYQANTAANIIKTVMEDSPIDVPLVVDQKIGKTWGK